MASTFEMGLPHKPWPMYDSYIMSKNNNWAFNIPITSEARHTY